jgi:hypothetical protein
MIKLRETTEWDVPVANGIYIFEKKPTGRTAKAIGFIAKGTTEPRIFNKPYTIDFKFRTFEVVE